MKFRKKPVVIDAVRWNGTQAAIDEIFALREGHEEGLVRRVGNDLVIETLEGDMRANLGDWIIRGVKGELYPCKAEIFEATYEQVGE